MTIPKRYDTTTEHLVEEFGPFQQLEVKFRCYWDFLDEPRLSAVHVLEAEGEYAAIRRDSPVCMGYLDTFLEPSIFQLVSDDSDGRYHYKAREAMSMTDA